MQNRNADPRTVISQESSGSSADKKDPVYFELNEIKSQIGEMLKAEKYKTALEAKLKKLSNSMVVNINESYFKEKEAAEAAQEPSKGNLDAAIGS